MMDVKKNSTENGQHIHIYRQTSPKKWKNWRFGAALRQRHRKMAWDKKKFFFSNNDFWRESSVLGSFLTLFGPKIFFGPPSHHWPRNFSEYFFTDPKISKSRQNMPRKLKHTWRVDGREKKKHWKRTTHSYISSNQPQKVKKWHFPTFDHVRPKRQDGIFQKKKIFLLKTKNLVFRDRFWAFFLALKFCPNFNTIFRTHARTSNRPRVPLPQTLSPIEALGILRIPFGNPNHNPNPNPNRSGGEPPNESETVPVRDSNMQFGSARAIEHDVDRMTILLNPLFPHMAAGRPMCISDPHENEPIRSVVVSSSYETGWATQEVTPIHRGPMRRPPTERATRGILAPIVTSSLDYAALKDMDTAGYLVMTNGTNLLDVLQDVEVFRNTVLVDKEISDHPRRRLSKHMLQYLPDMLRYGVVEPDTTLNLVMSLFCVPKKDDTLRLILDCRTLNERCYRPPEMMLPSIHDIIDYLMKNDFACSCDGKSWFYQFHLAPEVSRYFGAHICGHRGTDNAFVRFMKMAMGWSWAPNFLGIHCVTSKAKSKMTCDPCTVSSQKTSGLSGAYER